MKREKLIQHLKQHGCEFLREGGDHTIFINPANNQRSPIPRHREIRDLLANRICKQLEVPKPN
ncbi:MAG: type II toxin-antitoxin system HicA family toxin [Planctomycetaceae bacterium]|nr:type II toxin-antitoxin system HicA family toxin [Planctomycetaceae bacterium]MCA9111700.1 type II toxin-antitoxin system HicA family toxin [Planctomycetaceae bacterium]